MAECRTRFAPSPTGFLHLGGARTALYCYLEARRRGGAFVLRIEDTDRERSTSEAINGIIDGMQWLGLEYDEGPYYQTLRLDRYRDVAESMLRDGLAYRCDCSRERLDALREAAMASGDKPRYDGLCRDRGLSAIAPASVIRFRNPDHGEVVFDDRVRGHIEWRNQELDDLVIWRSDDYPTYNFAVVVDDIDMGITDVIRGDDHINNTPRQINIYRALKATPPAFAHLPMIHGADGAKLSKRHGAVSVLQYRDDGYLPQALLNYLVRLGWSHGDQEIFSREELVQLFDVGDVNRSAARFDLDKLDWINQQYLKELPTDEVAPHLERHLRALGLDAEAGPPAVDIVTALRDRSKTLKDMAEKARIWFEPVAEYDAKAVAKHLKGSDAVLEQAHAALASIDANAWSAETVGAVLQGIADTLDLGMGKVAQPLRVAMTGTAVSPSIEHTVALMGQAGALARIDSARPLAI